MGKGRREIWRLRKVGAILEAESVALKDYLRVWCALQGAGL